MTFVTLLGQAANLGDSGPLLMGPGANAAHVAAMGAWVGGLAALLCVWPLAAPGRRGPLAPRFGRLAAVSLAPLGKTVVLRGAVLAGPAPTCWRAAIGARGGGG